MPQGIVLRRATTQVTDGTVYVDGFSARDEEVVDLLAESDDADAAVRRALHVGARAQRLAQGHGAVASPATSGS